MRVALHRIEGQIAPLRPHAEITASSLAGEHLHYFALQDQLQRVRDQVRAISDRLEAERRSAQGIASLNVGNLPRRSKLTLSVRLHPDNAKRNILREMAAAQDIYLFIEDLMADSVAYGGDEVQEALREAADDLALLHLAVECVARKEPEQAVVYVWSSNRPDHKPRSRPAASAREAFDALFPDEISQLVEALKAAFEGPCGQEVRELSPASGQGGDALVVRGLTALPLARVEEGTHLFSPVHGGLVLVQVHAWPVPEGADPQAVLSARLEERRRWQQELAEGHASADNDPLRLLPVLRIYNENGTTVDLRTGLLGRTLPALYPFVVGTLPLPPKLR